MGSHIINLCLTDEKRQFEDGMKKMEDTPKLSMTNSNYDAVKCVSYVKLWNRYKCYLIYSTDRS